MGRIFKATTRRASKGTCWVPSEVSLTTGCQQEQENTHGCVASGAQLSNAGISACLAHHQSAQPDIKNVRKKDKAMGTQELWINFFADPSKWWDNRFNKVNPKLPDFVHKENKNALWIDVWSDPPWVEAKLSAVDKGVAHILWRSRTADPRDSAEDNGDPGGDCVGCSFQCKQGADNGAISSFRGLKILCDEGQLSEALQFVDFMDRGGLRISSTILYRLLQVCVSKGNLTAGRVLHCLITRSGFESDVFLGSHVIRMYTFFGSLWEAYEVFNKLLKPDVFAWSEIILAHAKLGQGEVGIKLYKQMQQSSVMPDGHTFVAVVKACTSAIAQKQGNLIHGNIVETGFESHAVVANSLIDLYTKCGSLEDASRVFQQSRMRDVVTWSAMIAGYAQHGDHQTALKLLHQMQQEGVEPNNVVWNAIITGYTQHGHFQEAFQLFEQMQEKGVKPDSVTFVSILKACTTLDQGKEVHCHIIRGGFHCDLIVANTLIDIYAKCGSLENAVRVFDNLKTRSMVTWNALIAGYAQNGKVLGALQFFRQMQQEGLKPDNVSWNALIAGYAQIGHVQGAFLLYLQMQQLGCKPDDVTFINILKACSSTATLDCIDLIHAQIFERGFHLNSMVANTLIDMYAKCGSLEDARRVFDVLSDRSIVTWNVMIFGYAQDGLGQEALELYGKLRQKGIMPDNITYVTVLKACASILALNPGKVIHDHIIKSSFYGDAHVWGSLIDMYAKCGSVGNALRLFERLQNRDLVTWNAIIGGYAQNCMYDQALKYFRDMQCDGLKPDDVTYVSLLSACSHVGLVREGCLHFKVMRDDHGIAPTLDHYNCMVDLLGRAGYLVEAEYLLESAPFQHNIVGWTSLLGHCRIHGNVEQGRRCFDHLVMIDCTYSCGYVIMANIYANSGMWEDADKIEEFRTCADAWKKPGSAFVHVDDSVHEFIVGDRGHQQSGDIFSKLMSLYLQMKDAGYMPLLSISFCVS